MSFLGWVTLAGVLSLTMALSSAYIKRLPLSSSIIYLALGFALGPHGFGVLSVNVREAVHWLEPLTEGAVIVALFIGGLKLRLPLRDPAWRAPLVLAVPVMIACIFGVALFAHLVLRIDLATALLLGAILAPTDPVLAGAVSVAHAADKSRLRYALSGEAGLNDGLAFPFVILALGWAEHGGAGPWLGGWALHRLLWAVPAALVLGYVLGHVVGELAIRLRSRTRDTHAPSDFLALALIALAYVGAQKIGAWGFLSVFAAGVGLRRAEMRVVRKSPHPAEVEKADDEEHPPAESLVAATETAKALKEPAVAAGALVAETLSFGDTAERILEVMLVVLVGAALGTHWAPSGLVIAAFLIVLLRPAVTVACLQRSPVPADERPLVGWFGLRGIGSLYYLSYALSHGVTGAAADTVCAITLVAIAASIVVHGISAQPLLDWLQRRRSGPSAAPRPQPTP